MRVEALHDFLLELPRLRAQLLRVMGPDSCIETTRFLIGVMGTFGVEAEPVSVVARVANAVAVQGLREGLDESSIAEAGGHVVIIGDRSGPAISHGRWHGHLAARAGSILVDGSLDQANRPQKGIHVEAGAHILPPNWDDGQPAAYELPGGVHVTYWHRPGDTSYRRTRAWRNGHRLFLQWQAAHSLVLP